MGNRVSAFKANNSFPKNETFSSAIEKAVAHDFATNQPKVIQDKLNANASNSNPRSARTSVGIETKLDKFLSKMGIKKFETIAPHHSNPTGSKVPSFAQRRHDLNLAFEQGNRKNLIPKEDFDGFVKSGSHSNLGLDLQEKILQFIERK